MVSRTWPGLLVAGVSLIITPLARPVAALDEASSPQHEIADEASGPQREILAAFKYPRLQKKSSEKLDLDLIIKNAGRQDETVLVEVDEIPESCRAELSDYGTTVGGVFVEAGERKTLTLSLRREAPQQAAGDSTPIPPGDYLVRVRAMTLDQALSSLAETRITVRPERTDAGEDREPVQINCSYPTLRGSNESDFKFSVEIHNNTPEDDMVSLRAESPRGWEVAFKPSYESKYIGSVKAEANVSKSIDVEVTPPAGAEIGTYPITIFAKLSKHDAEARRRLEVELTGRYRIKCGTLNDLLSLTAHGGEEAVVSVYVANQGTAAQSEVSFTSFKPENWKVEFQPEKIESIEPGGMKQVEVKITPAADALVGDYSLELDINGEKSTDKLELRVTVRAATTWAWVGAGIILVVVVGLTVLFKVLGRR